MTTRASCARASSSRWCGPALLIVGAIVFIPLSKGTSAVEVALGIASLVYGGLLGAFALGVFTKRPGQGSVVVGVAAGIGLVTFFRDAMAWPWYALVGSVVTVRRGRARERDRRRAGAGGVKT